MSYQLYADDECEVCILYAKPVQDKNPWKCIICGLIESNLYDILWFRYELQCNHQVHARCYKKWCKKEKTVGCPLCGPLSYTEANKFCEDCNQYGHSFCHSLLTH